MGYGPRWHDLDQARARYENRQFCRTITKTQQYWTLIDDTEIYPYASWHCSRCTYHNHSSAATCEMCGAESSQKPTQHTLGDFLDDSITEQMHKSAVSSTSDDEGLQMAIELSLTGNKTRNNLAVTKKTNQQNQPKHKKKTKPSRHDSGEFELYWKECCKFVHSYDRQRRRVLTQVRRQELDSSVNHRQLSVYVPAIGSVPAYVQYLLHTKCAVLREFIPSVKSLLQTMGVIRDVEVRSSWNRHHTWYESCRMHISDPRAHTKVRFKPVLDAKAMQRFVHRMQFRKKAKQISLVYTLVNLADLDQECSVTLKSFSTPQEEGEMIRYFGKDLLISGFLRQFSRGTIYDDVEALCLRFYHMSGASYEYARKYTRNEYVRCYLYKSMASWEEQKRWPGDCDQGTAFLCLSPTREHSWRHVHGKDVELHSLLPVYQVSMENSSAEYKSSWLAKEVAKICKRARQRYIERKWSAYHKLNRT